MTIVKIDYAMIAKAMEVGEWRWKRVNRERLGPGGTGDDLRIRDNLQMRTEHVQGALAELAVAKYLGVPYDARPEDFGKMGDVLNYEVRSTSSWSGHLRVFESEVKSHPDRVFVLVLVAGNKCRIAGGIRGRDVPAVARDFEEIQARGFVRAGSRPQWWVRQSDLTTNLLIKHEQTTKTETTDLPRKAA